MADFQQHIQQSKRNLAFLEQVNAHSNEFWDWQVTATFYVAVHIINAHIFQKTSLNYRSHEQVNQAINPFAVLSPAQLNEDIYLAYNKLQGLSRRSRYLCNEDHKKKGTNAHSTYDKHFARAILHLDKIMEFVKVEYKVDFTKIGVKCPELKGKSLSNFLVKG